MKKEIELNSGEIIKLPDGFSVEHKFDALGYTLYFGGYHCYIPYEQNLMFVEEMIKDLMFKSGMTPKEIIDYLTK